MKTGYKVFDAMTTKPVSVSPDATITECAELMNKYKVGSLVAKKNNKIAGIITDTDIIRKVIAFGMDPKKIKIEDTMVKSVITITPEKDLYDALVKMNEANIRQLPVLENGQIVGLLTLKDILKIEPALFELIVDKLEIREEERKPIHATREICQACGEMVTKVYDIDGVMMCFQCKKEREEHEQTDEEISEEE
jgi:signal-transduction protein with cAMP-binding, CBS, and nucleotidyltransferase domain